MEILLAPDSHDLARIMEFDTIVRVYPDGAVRSVEVAEGGNEEFYTPTPTLTTDGRDAEFVGFPGWTVLKGFSGQYGYTGGIMHPSEFIGGGLADHILSNPGNYVVVAVFATNDDEEALDMEDVGWAIGFHA